MFQYKRICILNNVEIAISVSGNEDLGVGSDVEGSSGAGDKTGSSGAAKKVKAPSSLMSQLKNEKKEKKKSKEKETKYAHLDDNSSGDDEPDIKYVHLAMSVVCRVGRKYLGFLQTRKLVLCSLSTGLGSIY